MCRPPSTEPHYRATIARGALTLVPWRRSLAGRGPSAALVHERNEAGVTFADLTIVPGEPGEHELIVTLLCRPTEQAPVELIADWAAAVGCYRRPWTDDGLWALDDRAARLGEIAPTCQTCGTHWPDAHPGAWLGVRQAGLFPLSCGVCGGSLTQWVSPHGEPGALVTDMGCDAPAGDEFSRDAAAAPETRQR